MRIIPIVLVVALLAGGCGGDDDEPAINDQRQRDNCEAEFKTLDVAGQAFFALYPDARSVTEEQLIEEQLLLQEMPNYDIEADGTVFATDEGACD